MKGVDQGLYFVLLIYTIGMVAAMSGNDTFGVVMLSFLVVLFATLCGIEEGTHP